MPVELEFHADAYQRGRAEIGGGGERDLESLVGQVFRGYKYLRAARQVLASAPLLCRGLLS
jgi:hypothetical protein